MRWLLFQAVAQVGSIGEYARTKVAATSVAATAKKSKEAAPAEEVAQPAAAEPAKEAPLASVKQKTELLLLLNNKHITQDEKAKMIESINTLDSERIQKAIAKVKKVIEERDGDNAQAAA